MDVYCRGATFEDLEEIYATIQDAFNANSQIGIRNAFKLMLTKPEDCRIIIEKEMNQEIIIGACPLFRYTCYFPPTELKSGGIFWFGIRKNYQRKGIGVILLQDVNNYLAQQGFDLNLLFTGKANFYRQAGYELGILNPGYILDVNKISNESGGICELRSFQKTHFPQIAKSYEMTYSSQCLSYIRTVNYWEAHYEVYPNIFDEEFKEIWMDDLIIGYIWIKDKAEGLIIEEWAINDEEIPEEKKYQIFNSILKNLKEKAKEIGKSAINFRFFPSHPIIPYLERKGAYNGMGSMSSLMGKIINLNSFFEKWIYFLENRSFQPVFQDQLQITPIFDFALICEDVMCQFSKDVNNKLSIKLNPAKIPANTVKISRNCLCLMALLNFQPSDMVDSELWECPEELLTIMDILFAPIYSWVNPLDKF